MDNRERRQFDESSKQGISDSIRGALEEGRVISYGDWGEGSKLVSVVGDDNKTYKFYKESDDGYYGWRMDIYSEDGHYENGVTISEDADQEYLEKMFSQDISDKLRTSLEESGEVSYEDYGDKKVISVVLGKKEFRFYYSGYQYSSWAMEVKNEGEGEPTFMEIREESDVQFLEGLFEKKS
jgi:hypothetical protein